MFLSTFEKQLDLKRRIVVPQEFRAAVSGPFDGVFCFPSIEADCVEGGGKALFDRYNGVIEELPFGDPLRSALETSVLGGMARLSFDTAGRITLPDLICKAFGLTDWVSVVGLGDDALWSTQTSTLLVRKRYQVLSIALTIADQPHDNLEQAKALAALALPKM